MKKNNPLKKLRLVKKTIAHISYEQMTSARGGDPITRIHCYDTNAAETIDCTTVIGDTSLCVSVVVCL